MSWLSGIMASLVFILSIQEGISTMLPTSQSSCQTTCCSTSCSMDIDQEQSAPNNEKSSDGCQGNMCNPFLACGSCALAITPMYHSSPSILGIHSPLFSKYSFHYSNSFISDFWQPPKFV